MEKRRFALQLKEQFRLSNSTQQPVTDDATTFVEEEYIELNSNKEVPNPEEDGFDVPVL